MMTTTNTRLALSITLMALFNVLHAQLHFDWAVSQGSRESDFTGSFRQDDQGHIYTMCFITDTADLDPGNGEDILIPWFDETTVFTKWTTGGEYLWSGIFQGQGEHGGAIMQLKNNSVLMYLYYIDSLVYIRNHTPITLSVNPGEHICVLTLDLDGHVTSFRDFLNNRSMYFAHLSKRDDGSILAGGGFYDSMTVSTPNGDTTLFSQGEYDGFIISFDSNWRSQWIRTVGGSDDDYIADMAVANNRIYYAIGYNDTMTMSTVNGLETFPCVDGEENGLFGSLSLNGQNLTAQSFGGDQNDEIRAITADEEENIYICGLYEGTVNFEHPDAPPIVFTSTNLDEGFISKYSPDGLLQWTRIIRNSEYGGMHNLKLLRNESLYVTGSYNGHTDLDPGPDSIIVETPNWGDAYTTKFDKNGNQEWVYNFVGEDLEGIVEQIISPDGHVYFIGFHNGILDADPSLDTFLVPNLGNSDMFMISLTEENVITSSLQPEWVEMRLYPNPSTDELFISANTNIENVRVTSINGARLSIPVSYSLKTVSLHVESLQPGIYIASVKTPTGYTNMKFVRQ